MVRPPEWPKFTKDRQNQPGNGLSHPISVALKMS
jgi:hypothetical protein